MDLNTVAGAYRAIGQAAQTIIQAERATGDPERGRRIWLIVRRALLMIVTVIEREYGKGD